MIPASGLHASGVHDVVGEYSKLGLEHFAPDYAEYFRTLPQETFFFRPPSILLCGAQRDHDVRCRLRTVAS